MRRVFTKGLDCLHLLLGCKCPPQPITMKLRTPVIPARHFAVLCAVYTAHGRAALRERKGDEAYDDWLRQLRDSTDVDVRLERE